MSQTEWVAKRDEAVPEEARQLFDTVPEETDLRGEGTACPNIVEPLR